MKTTKCTQNIKKGKNEKIGKSLILKKENLKKV